MSDDSLETALWLATGGAAGWAAGRWLVPYFAPTASAASSPRVAPRAAAIGPSGPSGPSGSMQPIDPYAALPIDPSSTRHTGPSGSMQPIDPYAPSISTAPTTTLSPTTIPTVPLPSLDGPITRPSQLATAPAVVSPTVPSTTLITTPSQVDGRVTSPTTPSATPALPSSVGGLFATTSRVRRFDPLYERYRGTLPIEYVRALVERESNGVPATRTGSAIGLLQIVPVVLTDYNKRHGTRYRGEHLIDPASNVAIGCELLRLIVESYRKNHPQIRTLQTDWDNLRFVELLTFGWNAGYSEAGGVGRVARYLEGLGAVDLTIDQVSAHARLAGASKHLSSEAKVAWCKSVASLYQRERALQRHAALLV